jgi:hypothetical protein
MMDRINTSDQRWSDRISYFDHLAYFRMAAPPFSVAVHRAIAPSDGYLPSCFNCHLLLLRLHSRGDLLSSNEAPRHVGRMTERSSSAKAPSI